MTRQLLRENLLQTMLFIENGFFEDYLDLVLEKQNLQEVGYTEKHHILPRAYYEHEHIPVDSSQTNLITLSYADHCKAHYLLYFCTLGYLKNANANAVHYIHKMLLKLSERAVLTPTQADFDLLQSYMDKIIDDPYSRYWSAHELSILKQYYGVEGAKVSKRFKNKTRATCLHKASSLGLSAPTTAWSDQELAILNQYYPLEGGKVYKRIPPRTEQACVGMAKKLQLTHSRKWEQEEIIILQQFYPEEGSAVFLRLPNRTKATCVMKAKELGLTHKSSWTKEQLDILKMYYPQEGALVGMRINKSREACRQKASKLGLKYKGD